MSGPEESPIMLVSFSKALTGMKVGKKFQRQGWNGKGLHVRLHETVIGTDMGSQEPVYIQPFFVITGVTTNTWVPSVSDLLAEDWIEVI